MLKIKLKMVNIRHIIINRSNVCTKRKQLGIVMISESSTERKIMQEWKDLFRTHILERGKIYYYEGAVTQLEKTDDGYSAIVEGSEDYEVEIATDGQRVMDMFCSCPYAAEGNYCKHMAAVLYQIEGEDENDVSRAESVRERQVRAKKELEDIIEIIPEEELRALIGQLADSDNKIKNLILTSYAPKIDVKQINRLKQEVDDIIYRYGDRAGFIDYRNAWGFTREIGTFLGERTDILIERGCYSQAFEITNYVFQKIGNIDMDDSDGGTSVIADTCYEIWEQILKNSSEEEKEDMFQWFVEHQTGGYVIDYFEEYISNFLMNEFHDTEMLKKKLEELDKIIEQQKASAESKERWGSYYGLENHILKRLEIMEELGCSEKEISEYRKENWQFSEVRKLEIQEQISKGNIAQAIAVLRESKEMDREYPGLVACYSEQLIALYGKQGDTGAYKKELKTYVFTCSQRNLDYIKKLKKVSSQSEWEKYRERILEGGNGYQIYYPLLEFEGMYERMLESIRKGKSVYFLDQYEKLLKKKFPEQVRDIYISYICSRAERTSDRKQYKELMYYLKKLKTYPDGKKKAKEIAAGWRSAYYRRSAMMDELQKAGF